MRSTTATPGAVCNAFTVDVEDYFHVQGFAQTVHRRDWDHYELRVVHSTHRILRLLQKHNIQGTFFVLGWVAQRCTDLVRDIQKDGHEIGSHSYWHRLIYEMTPEDFAADLRRSCEVLSDVTGQPVTSFRAPSFSITRRSLWALDVLFDQGIRFDSSIFPVRHDVYGIPDAERFPHAIVARGTESLWEFPPAVRRYGRFNLPVAGGGYFRLFPAALSIHLLREINRAGQPFAFYIHPWELDPDQPRLGVPLKSRFRHYQNLKSSEAKLGQLLGAFSFGTITTSLTAAK